MNIDQININKVGIIGIGFVGNAILKSLQKHGFDQSTVKIYDKYKKDIDNFENILDTDLVYLCLPTLYSDNKKEYDKTSLHEICYLLNKNKYNGYIVIKSTVEPGTSEDLANKYGLKIFHNPEFLTARTAVIDYHNQKHIVLGKTSKISQYISLYNFYKKYYPEAEISVCKSYESESMKMFVNSFYAMKVEIFTEFYLLCLKNNADYNTIKDLMLKNGWINPMHTTVPGPDGLISYGGSCFPKDTEALLQYMKRLDVPHEVLEATIRERNKLRG